jgi:hypothetical protein
MDANVHSGITAGVRKRSVTAITAQEGGTDQLPDPDLLNRSTALGYILFTHDKDFLVEAARRQHAGESFAGVVYAHPVKVPVGKCIDDLELIAKAYDPVDMVDRVEHLPL